MTEVDQSGNAGAGSPVPGSVVEVAAGLIFRQGRLLITQRHPDAHLGGLWEFPGGKRETSETYEQALRRELVEELGVEVAVGRLIRAVTHAYPRKTVHLRFFQCRLVAGEPRPIDCHDLKWVAPDELADHEFPAADSGLLEKLKQAESLWG